METIKSHCRNARLCLQKAFYARKARLPAEELNHLKNFESIVFETLPSLPSYERTDKEVVELEFRLSDAKKRVFQLEKQLENVLSHSASQDTPYDEQKDDACNRENTKVNPSKSLDACTSFLQLSALNNGRDKTIPVQNAPLDRLDISQHPRHIRSSKSNSNSSSFKQNEPGVRNIMVAETFSISNSCVPFSREQIMLLDEREMDRGHGCSGPICRKKNNDSAEMDKNHGDLDTVCRTRNCNAGEMDRSHGYSDTIYRKNKVDAGGMCRIDGASDPVSRKTNGDAGEKDSIHGGTDPVCRKRTNDAGDMDKIHGCNDPVCRKRNIDVGEMDKIHGGNDPACRKRNIDAGEMDRVHGYRDPICRKKNGDAGEMDRSHVCTDPACRKRNIDAGEMDRVHGFRDPICRKKNGDAGEMDRSHVCTDTVCRKKNNDAGEMETMHELSDAVCMNKKRDTEEVMWDRRHVCTNTVCRKKNNVAGEMETIHERSDVVCMKKNRDAGELDSDAVEMDRIHERSDAVCRKKNVDAGEMERIHERSDAVCKKKNVVSVEMERVHEHSDAVCRKKNGDTRGNDSICRKKNGDAVEMDRIHGCGVRVRRKKNCDADSVCSSSTLPSTGKSSANYDEDVESWDSESVLSFDSFFCDEEFEFRCTGSATHDLCKINGPSRSMNLQRPYQQNEHSKYLPYETKMSLSLEKPGNVKRMKPDHQERLREIFLAWIHYLESKDQWKMNSVLSDLQDPTSSSDEEPIYANHARAPGNPNMPISEDRSAEWLSEHTQTMSVYPDMVKLPLKSSDNSIFCKFNNADSTEGGGRTTFCNPVFDFNPNESSPREFENAIAPENVKERQVKSDYSGKVINRSADRGGENREKIKKNNEKQNHQECQNTSRGKYVQQDSDKHCQNDETLKEVFMLIEKKINDSMNMKIQTAIEQVEKKWSLAHKNRNEQKPSVSNLIGLEVRELNCLKDEIANMFSAYEVIQKSLNDKGKEFQCHQEMIDEKIVQIMEASDKQQKATVELSEELSHLKGKCEILMKGEKKANNVLEQVWVLVEDIKRSINNDELRKVVSSDMVNIKQFMRKLKKDHEDDRVTSKQMEREIQLEIKKLEHSFEENFSNLTKKLSACEKFEQSMKCERDNEMALVMERIEALSHLYLGGLDELRMDLVNVKLGFEGRIEELGKCLEFCLKLGFNPKEKEYSSSSPIDLLSMQLSRQESVVEGAIKPCSNVECVSTSNDLAHPITPSLGFGNGVNACLAEVAERIRGQYKQLEQEIYNTTSIMTKERDIVEDIMLEVMGFFHKAQDTLDQIEDVWKHSRGLEEEIMQEFDAAKRSLDHVRSAQQPKGSDYSEATMVTDSFWSKKLTDDMMAMKNSAMQFLKKAATEAAALEISENVFAEHCQARCSDDYRNMYQAIQEVTERIRAKDQHEIAKVMDNWKHAIEEEAGNNNILNEEIKEVKCRVSSIIDLGRELTLNLDKHLKSFQTTVMSEVWKESLQFTKEALLETDTMFANEGKKVETEEKKFERDFTHDSDQLNGNHLSHAIDDSLRVLEIGNKITQVESLHLDIASKVEEMQKKMRCAEESSVAWSTKYEEATTVLNEVETRLRLLEGLLWNKDANTLKAVSELHDTHESFYWYIDKVGMASAAGRLSAGRERLAQNIKQSDKEIPKYAETWMITLEDRIEHIASAAYANLRILDAKVGDISYGMDAALKGATVAEEKCNALASELVKFFRNLAKAGQHNYESRIFSGRHHYRDTGDRGRGTHRNWKPPSGCLSGMRKSNVRSSFKGRFSKHDRNSAKRISTEFSPRRRKAFRLEEQYNRCSISPSKFFSSKI